MSKTPSLRRSNKPFRALVLVGFMGSGKTSVGQVLSRRLGWGLQPGRQPEGERVSLRPLSPGIGERHHPSAGLIGRSVLWFSSASWFPARLVWPRFYAEGGGGISWPATPASRPARARPSR